MARGKRARPRYRASIGNDRRYFHAVHFSQTDEELGWRYRHRVRVDRLADFGRRHHRNGPCRRQGLERAEQRRQRDDLSSCDPQRSGERSGDGKRVAGQLATRFSLADVVQCNVTGGAEPWLTSRRVPSPVNSRIAAAINSTSSASATNPDVCMTAQCTQCGGSHHDGRRSQICRHFRDARQGSRRSRSSRCRSLFPIGSCPPANS